MSRAGYTLVELIVSMALLGFVALGISKAFMGNQRMFHAQTERVGVQQSVRAAATLLPAEFRELDASDGDIYTMSETAIQMRAMRQLGFLCAAPVLPAAGGVATFKVRKDLFFGARPFDVARDSLLIYYEGDESTRNDDGWVAARPTAISDDVCPLPDALPAWHITATLWFGPGQVNNGGTARIPNGSPVRGFVPVRYEIYQAADDGRWYVGYDELSDGAAILPLLGPVTAGGLSLRYYDSTGVVTASPARVQMIEVRLRAEGARPVHQAAGGVTAQIESVATRVALRNNRRW